MGQNADFDLSDLNSVEHSSPPASPPLNETPAASEPSEAPAAPKLCKYSLRTRPVRRQLKDQRQGPGAGPGTGPRTERRRSQQLSRYRRRVANTRERDRMRDINTAFDALERALPRREETPAKVTKITVLRLAIGYIKALRETLTEDFPDVSHNLHQGNAAAPTVFEEVTSSDHSFPSSQAMETGGLGCRSTGIEIHSSSPTAADSELTNDVRISHDILDSIQKLKDCSEGSNSSHDVMREFSTVAGETVSCREPPELLDRIHDLRDISRGTTDNHPLDEIQDLADFQLPVGMDLLLDIGPDIELNITCCEPCLLPYPIMSVSNEERNDAVGRTCTVSSVSGHGY